MKPEHSEKSIGCKSIREWNELWTPLSGGFKTKHPELSNSVGLARAVLNGQTMYILRGTEHLHGGIEKSLQRIRGKAQTGNSGYGAQMIRKHIHELQLEILVIGCGLTAVEPTKALKKALVKLVNPLWNMPHLKRMAMLHAGKPS